MVDAKGMGRGNHGNEIRLLDSLHQGRYDRNEYSTFISLHENAMSDTTQAIASPGLLTAREKGRVERVRIVLAFLAIYVIWGSTYLAIRYAVETIPPLYTAGFRHLVAGTILLFWALAKGQRPTWAQIKASVVIGFFFFLVGHG